MTFKNWLGKRLASKRQRRKLARGKPGFGVRLFASSAFPILCRRSLRASLSRYQPPLPLPLSRPFNALGHFSVGRLAFSLPVSSFSCRRPCDRRVFIIYRPSFCLTVSPPVPLANSGPSFALSPSPHDILPTDIMRAPENWMKRSPLPFYSLLETSRSFLLFPPRKNSRTRHPVLEFR